MPALKKLNINMWILATPRAKTETVVKNRQHRTARVKGIRRKPPPGDNIC